MSIMKDSIRIGKMFLVFKKVNIEMGRNEQYIFISYRSKKSFERRILA